MAEEGAREAEVKVPLIQGRILGEEDGPTPLFWSPKTIYPFCSLGTFSLSRCNEGITFWVLIYVSVLVGRRPNGFLGLSLNDRTILFLVILVDKTFLVG